MDNLLFVAKTFLENAWRFFVEIEIPGLDISVGALSVALFIIGFSIRIFSYLTGFHMGGGSYGQAADAADKVKSAYDHSHRRKIGF